MVLSFNIVSLYRFLFIHLFLKRKFLIVFILPSFVRVNPFTPTDLYGMVQIKAWTVPF